jgi:hypothetical protein
MWSRATAEARAGFASICDISSFPTVVRWNCRPTGQSGRARAGGRRAADTPRENNHGPGTGRAPRRYLDAAGWRAPSPQPLTHPARDPGSSAPGSSFSGFAHECPKPEARAQKCGGAQNCAGAWNSRPGSRLPAWRITLLWAGVGAGLADLLPSGRNPALLPSRSVRPVRPPGCPGAPSRCGRRSRGSRGCRSRSGP